MQTEHYRDNLQAALQTLMGVNRDLYLNVIGIAMQGELKDFNDAVPVGEVHKFDFAIFENCTDTNIQLLVKLMRAVDETFLSIQNINNIEWEEGEEEVGSG